MCDSTRNIVLVLVIICLVVGLLIFVYPRCDVPRGTVLNLGMSLTTLETLLYLLKIDETPYFVVLVYGEIAEEADRDLVCGGVIDDGLVVDDKTSRLKHLFARRLVNNGTSGGRQRCMFRCRWLGCSMVN